MFPPHGFLSKFVSSISTNIHSLLKWTLVANQDFDVEDAQPTGNNPSSQEDTSDIECPVGVNTYDERHKSNHSVALDDPQDGIVRDEMTGVRTSWYLSS